MFLIYATSSFTVIQRGYAYNLSVYCQWQKKKRELVCMQPCECIFLRVLHKSLVQLWWSIQWSNLYLFSTLNEFNSQQSSVAVHWLETCALCNPLGCKWAACYYNALILGFRSRALKRIMHRFSFLWALTGFWNKEPICVCCVLSVTLLI